MEHHGDDSACKLMPIWLLFKKWRHLHRSAGSAQQKRMFAQFKGGGGATKLKTICNTCLNTKDNLSKWQICFLCDCAMVGNGTDLMHTGHRV